ncbi:MAG: Gfo/Idh/MocA family oxidoreductase [Myxococcales bacterium]|nr:Gfo/Idh/MocA family oxidoreductase [Myxococcales bacterium]
MTPSALADVQQARSATPVRVAVAGTGYWGVNHVRAFAALKGAQLVAVVEPNEAARQKALGLAPAARGLATLEEALAAPDIDALVLATPAVLHAQQALAVLAAGKHVFVEKPMALSIADAEALVAAAAVAKRTFMVGHLMVHHPVMRKLDEMIRDGSIGEIYYVYATRVNLGRVRKDENALWSFGPHDISMILHLFGMVPDRVSAQGHGYLQKGVQDVVFVNLDFPDGRMAHIQLSWLDPRKERRITIVGSRRMVEFDDAHPTEKLRIYDKGYDRPPEFTEFAQYLTIRQGDIHIPRVDTTEPLGLECRHFIQCITDGTEPLTGVREGLAVVRVLAAAQRSLDAGGTPFLL